MRHTKRHDKKSSWRFVGSNIPIILALLLTVAHWLVLALQLPLFSGLTDWFWKFIPKSAGPAWLIALLVLGAIIAIGINIKIKERYKTKLVVLIILGVCLQYGFALLEERGLDAITDRITKTGHAEFARVAVLQDDTFQLVSRYEELLESRKLGRYANSKPPGTLLFYVFTKKIAQIGFNPDESQGERKASIKARRIALLKRLRTTATFLWPLISYLVLIPLYLYTAMIFDRDKAILACTLYLFVPSVNLITLHTDQVIYPLLFMIPTMMSAIAAEKRSLLLAFLAGIFIYLSIWFTFAMIFFFPLIAASCFFLAPRSDKKWKYWPLVKIVLGVALGALLVDLFFRYAFNYDILLRYENAMSYHAKWRKWETGFLSTSYYAALNLLEYALWIGIPLFVLLATGFLSSIKAAWKKKRLEIQSSQPLAVLGTVLVIAFIGKTKGESARLWLFMVPVICMVAANVILTKFDERKRWVIAIVLLLQLGTVYLTKVNQDFW